MLFFRSLLTSAAVIYHTAHALTPVGHTPSGKPIYIAPNGSRAKQVGSDFKIFAPNGTVIHTFVNIVPKNSKKRSVAKPVRRQGLSNAVASVSLTNTSDLLEAFNTSMTIPPSPAIFESQLLWMSASVIAADDTGTPFASVRAVIQYGASALQGGPFWTIAAQLELLPDAGGILQIAPIGFDPTVSVGTTIPTSITHRDEGDNLFWYLALFDGMPGGPQIEVGFVNPAASAVAGMEEEGVTQSSDYPLEPFRFEKTNLALTSGFPDIEWNVSVDPVSGAYVAVDVDGSENAEISIHF
ncbi:hypothetical protein R3P38DRAFT_3003282 [Favolaschia claudopus]|uniref:Glycoside hydrolase 131 catalytic N-terminal domain-containing protein n=1 Tax=Favolaschia claudopus TaxID=2862362 RepID=A0AAW0AMN0_9AGAR